MENIVLTIGGLIKSFTWSDLFFFVATVVLILLLVYIIYLIRVEETDNNVMLKPVDPTLEKPKKDLNEQLDNIVNNLSSSYAPKPIDLSKYEQEREDTAIISYDELLQRSSNDIAYETDYSSGIDDVVVKKVDSTNMSSTREYVDLPKAVMMCYEDEEKFLKALKVLQSNLVR